MHIGMACKVLNHDCGGNTRYARSLISALINNGCRITPLGSDHPFRYYAQEALGFPGSKGQDVVFYPADTGLALSPSVPTVATIHGINPLKPGLSQRAAHYSWLLRAKRLAHVAHRVITVSENSKRDIHQHLDVDLAKIEVIHHGIDQGTFAPADPGQIATVGNKYSLNSPYILYYGNVEPRKNLPFAAQCIQTLRTNHNIELVIVGRTLPGNESLTKELASSPGVRVLGPVPDEDLIPLISGAAATILTSFYEGFGMTTIESMACRTPVVCSRVGSLPEVVANAGLLFDSGDEQGFCSAVTAVLTDSELSEKLAAAGAARAATFTWQNSAEQHLNVFQEAIKSQQ